MIIYDPLGLRRARMLCQWELGDPSWADRIITAYLDPDSQEEGIEELEDDPEYSA